MKTIAFIFTAMILSISACSGEAKTKQDSKEKSEEHDEVKDSVSAPVGTLKEQIDDYIFVQDTSFEKYEKINSLPFANVKMGKEYQSFFYYDSAGELKIIEEFENEAKSQNIKRFYYKGKNLQYLNLIHIDYENEKNFIEKKYYFENDTPFYGEEVIEFGTDPKTISVEGFNVTNEYALQMFNLQGDFAITFNGFIEQPSGAFLIVNAAKKGFNSALLVDQAGGDDFAEDLYKNKKKYLGKKLKVKWEGIVDPSNGLKQNAYRGGEWIN